MKEKIVYSAHVVIHMFKRDDMKCVICKNGETTKEVLQKANEAYKKGAEIEVINMRKTA